MSELIPKETEIRFWYECPECGAMIFQNLAEVQQIGKFLCGCGLLLKFKYINEIKYDLVYGNHTSTEEVKPARPSKTVVEKTDDGINMSFEIDAISGLERLGHKRSEAKRIVRSYLDSHSITQDFDYEFVRLVNFLTGTKKS